MNKKYILYTYWFHEYNSKTIALMNTLKEVYEEISLTWLDNVFQLFKAVIVIFTDLILDL